MSYVSLVTVNCDMQDHAPGCPWWVAQARSKTAARAEARAAGWTRVAGMDLSKPCRAKYEGKSCPHSWESVSRDTVRNVVVQWCPWCEEQRTVQP